MRLMTLRPICMIVGIFVIFFSMPALADMRQQDAAGPDVVVTLSGSILRDGQFVPIEKAGQVKPGELVRWDIAARNSGAAPAKSYAASARVPSGTSFVSGSALGESAPAVSYSIDGGHDFAAPPMVMQRHADGTTSLVVAQVSAYTNVRFSWTQPINAGETRSAHYDVRVK
jgi:uncharacterized repeat protein (TIGR01451 family)